MGTRSRAGRLGGLAIAFGVGGALLSAHATASADTPSEDAGAGSAPAAQAGPRAARGAQHRVTADEPARRNAAAASPARPARAVEPRGPRRPSVPAEQLGQAPPGSARRDTAGAGTTRAVFPQTITVSTEIFWNQGVIEGALDATSSRGLPLTYRVLDRPSDGGKLTLTAGPQDTERFSYLPYMTIVSDPAGDEQFSVLVTETTPLDNFLTGLPLVGGLIELELNRLRRLPVVSDLLSPLIGSSLVVPFDVNPAELADGRPVAFTYKMPSFDGTLISLNYYPALNVATGQTPTAPTVLNGPDLGFPGNTEATFVWAPSLVEIVPGIPTLREGASPFPGGYTGSTGFNVITWDPRGEWASGGVMELDSPFYEARDVASIISWAGSDANIAASQVAAIDGDPLVGMVGGSYGGGIQFTAAAIDPRIDAIVPSIAWNSLIEALYPSNTFKTVIGTELLLALIVTEARVNSQVYPAIITGDLFNWLSPDARAVLASAGPGILSGNITAPSLFQQGTVDILFELDAANVNAQLILQRNPTLPVKTTWFCGGHGVCLLPLDLQEQQGNQIMSDTLRWLDAYAAGNAGAADPIPVFQWWDQTGQYYSSALAPFAPGFNNPEPLVYEGSGGGLLLVPLLGGSGPSAASVPPAEPTVFSTAFALASGGPASNAVSLPVAAPIGTRVAGAPTLSFSYRGLGTSRAVYAQLVDDATGQVIGNIVTPIPVTLDGQQRSIEIPMADIAYTVYGAGDTITLQITSSALPYANLTAWGFIDITDVSLEVPTVADDG